MDILAPEGLGMGSKNIDFSSLLRFLGFCAGMAGVWMALNGKWEVAVGIIVLATVFDFLEEFSTSVLNSIGQKKARLNSYLLCFGLAPTILLYYWTLQNRDELGWAVVFLFCSGVALRLVRFHLYGHNDRLAQLDIGSAAVSVNPVFQNFIVDNLKISRAKIWVILTISGFFVAALFGLHFLQGTPFGNLTRDPSVIAGVPLYTGFLSQVGILLWSAAAAVCFLGATVIFRQAGCQERQRFFLTSGLLTFILGVDDAFLLHEGFFPHFGVPEKLVFLCYGVFVLYFLVRFHSIILKTEFVLLGIAFGFLGLSVVMDVFPISGLDPFLFEDGAKFVGIVSWLVYFFCTVKDVMSQRVMTLEPAASRYPGKVRRKHVA